MKKVLIISYQYPPCASSGVYRLLRFLKALPAQGWSPVVVTVQPSYYPPGMPLDNNLAEEFARKNELQIIKTKMLAGVEQATTTIRSSVKSKAMNKPALNITPPFTGGKTVWQSFKDFVTISLMLPDKQNRWIYHGAKAVKQVCRNDHIDLVYAHGGPWSALVIGALAKRSIRLPLVLDFRDPWTDNPYDDLQSSVRRLVNNALERWCLSEADYVVTNTEALNSLFVKKYKQFSEDKFITITNGYDEDDYFGVSLSPAGNDPAVTVVHTGTLYAKRSPMPFLTVIAELIQDGTVNKDEIRVSLIGKVDFPQIEYFLRENGLKEIVSLPGLVARNEALKHIFSADILLLLQQGTKLQVPGKLFEYIRAGKPIFTISDGGATTDIILQNKLGLVAFADNHEDIKRKFTEIFFDALEAKRTGGVSRYVPDDEIIQSFSSEVQAKKLADIFNKSVNV